MTDLINRIVLTAQRHPIKTLSDVSPGEGEASEGVLELLTRDIAVHTWLLAVLIGLAALLLVWVVALLVLANRRKKKMKGMRKQKNRKHGPVTSVHIGKVHDQGAREYQQDCFGVSDAGMLNSQGLLAVVADGMGGLADGDRISTAVVETILDGFLYSRGQGTPEQVLLTLAQWGVREVNAVLGPENYRKSGSTLVAGLIRDSLFSWISVGDSRICLYRGGQLVQLNREHDFKQKLALQAVNGEIPLQEVYTDERSGGLVSFLGMGRLEQIDLPAEPLRLIPGDKLILMSDGVYNALEDWEIIAALEKGEEAAPEALHEAIRQKAYQNQDNYTAVILTCKTEETAGKAKQERSRKS